MKLLHQWLHGRTRAKEVIEQSEEATLALQESLEKLDATVMRYVSQEDECCPPKDQRRRLTDQYADAITKSKRDEND